VPLDPPLEPLRYTLAAPRGVGIPAGRVHPGERCGSTRPWWSARQTCCSSIHLDAARSVLRPGKFTCTRALGRARSGSGGRRRAHRACPRATPSQRHRQRRISPRQPRDTTRRALAWMRQSFTHVLLDPAARTGRRRVGGAGGLAPQRLVYIFLSPGQSRARSWYWCTSTASRCRRRV